MQAIDGTIEQSSIDLGRDTLMRFPTILLEDGIRIFDLDRILADPRLLKAFKRRNRRISENNKQVLAKLEEARRIRPKIWNIVVNI